MCSFTSSLIVKGWKLLRVISSALLLLTYFDCSLDNAILRHSSSKKRLIERRATTSACQSWRTVPFASGILLEGRHFIPVLGQVSRQATGQQGDWGIFSPKSQTRQPIFSWSCVSIYIMRRTGVTGYNNLEQQFLPEEPILSDDQPAVSACAFSAVY